MRMQQAPTDAQLAALNERFGALCSPPGVVRANPFEPEKKENDKLQLARISFTLTHHSSGVLREIIDTVNSFVAA
jgi:hypothetical protein